jgi:type II secretory pathway pseudopilin PulG
MKAPQRKGRAGFTLIEMTLALALSMGIASVIVGLLQQQVSFTRVLSNFQFLRDEAPQVNTLLANLINQADSYRLYTDRTNAMASTGAVNASAGALRLRFRNPDGTSSNAIISFEELSGKKQLNFYYRGTSDVSWPSSPSWTITSRPALVDFSNNTGILLIAMTGPNGEEITFAGNPD